MHKLISPSKSCGEKLFLRSKQYAAQGFTLVEVLVSILVLSFGMLGMVGMQAFALQSNREAKLQSQATNLARELGEMMRGNNQIGIREVATDNPYLFAATSPLTLEPESFCLGVGNANVGCTTALDVARAEMTDWLARVDRELSGARVTVCFDSSPYDSKGLPQWGCTAGANAIAVVKIGWTRNSTDRSKTGSSMLERASDTNSRPGVLFPVTSGNPLGTAL